MISVDSITKRYGELHAVRDVSFDVQKAEVVGFLGPNGAGKTTTMRILTGSLQPDAGRVSFEGDDIGADLPAARAMVGYLPESNALYGEMLVSEYLSFACELRGIRGPDRTRALARAVEQTELGDAFTRPISELSKGFRQRVGLAAAIVHEPEILVLDEPTEGLDPNQRVGIRALIRSLGEDRTVLLSTHVLAEVEAICSRLIIIHRGAVAADGSVDELLAARKGGVRYVIELDGEAEPWLAALPEVQSVQSEPVDGRARFTLAASDGRDLRPLVFREAAQRGWTLWELHRERVSLEQVFRSLTADVDRAAEVAAESTPPDAAEADPPEAADASDDGEDEEVLP